MNYKNLYIQGLILSNILCEKEMKLKKREKPKYGIVMLLVSQVQNYKITPGQNKNPNYNNERLILELMYLTQSNDPNHLRVKELQAQQRISLFADPFTIFTKPNREFYHRQGYLNYSYKLWANNTQNINLSLINSKSDSHKLKLKLVKNDLILPNYFGEYLEQIKLNCQFKRQDSSMVREVS